VPDPPRWFVLLADAIDDIDFTAGKTLVELAQQLADRNVVFAVANVQDDVLPELERFGLIDVIGHDHVFANVEDALAAFQRAGS